MNEGGVGSLINEGAMGQAGRIGLGAMANLNDRGGHSAQSGVGPAQGNLIVERYGAQAEIAKGVHVDGGLQGGITDEHHAIPPLGSPTGSLVGIEPDAKGVAEAMAVGEGGIKRVIVPHAAGFGGAPCEQAASMGTEHRESGQIIDGTEI